VLVDSIDVSHYDPLINKTTGAAMKVFNHCYKSLGTNHRDNAG